jgi:hypothetical protein
MRFDQCCQQIRIEVLVGVKVLIGCVFLFLAAAPAITIEKTEFDGRTIRFVGSICGFIDAFWHWSEKTTEQLRND